MMKLLHTADLHIGQILYQNYDRCDEHLHFFKQLTQWCKKEQPDALLVSGDVFDIQQPSTATKKQAFGTGWWTSIPATADVSSQAATAATPSSRTER